MPALTTRRKIHKAKKHLEAGTELKNVEVGLLHELCLQSSDERFVALGHALADPIFQFRGLPALCANFGIGLKDVAAFFKEMQLANGTLKQMIHAPDIMETNAVAAIGRKVPCPTCAGRKELYQKCLICDGLCKTENGPCIACKEAGMVSIGPCLTCSSTGWVQDAGDSNAVKGFMESAGLTNKGGPMVNINQNFGSAAGGSFEELMRQAEKPARIIDAAPIEAGK